MILLLPVLPSNLAQVGVGVGVGIIMGTTTPVATPKS